LRTSRTSANPREARFGKGLINFTSDVVRVPACGRSSFSCLPLEIRLATMTATVAVAVAMAMRGRGTNRLYEPDGLEGLEAPTTGSRYVVLCDSVTYSRSVCGPRAKAAKSLVAARSPLHATLFVYERTSERTNDLEVLRGSDTSWHPRGCLCFTENPLASAATSANPAG